MAARKFPHPFSRMAADFRAMLRKAPTQVGGIALSQFKQHFRDQGVDGSKWKPRAGDSEKEASRAILIKTGRLRRGMRNAPLSSKARVINDVPYAGIHNEGGKVSGTATVRSHTRRNGSKVKSHSRKFSFTMPARPFMTNSTTLDQKINIYFDKQLETIFNKT